MELTQKQVNEIKDKVQKEARLAFRMNNSWGIIVAGTGSGKSKIAIDEARDILELKNSANILLVVPTEKLRDIGWKEEFIKWGVLNIYGLHVQRVCYASLSSLHNQYYDLVILDECHNLTPVNAIVFKNNIIERCMALTATEPGDKTKQKLLSDLKLKPVYKLPLDESVDLGIIAPYEITVVLMNIDNVTKYIKAGSSSRPFYTTERGQYDYLTQRLEEDDSKMNRIFRTRMIYNLRSKTEIAKLILKHVIPPDIRTLIFCGSKDQADQVCPYTFYSKPTKSKKPEDDNSEYELKMQKYQGNTSLDSFKRGDINQIACVEALNEGQNFEGLDCGFIIQASSSELDLIQRIGRLLRFRPGHIGRIIILCAEDTIDYNWMREATKNLRQNRITLIRLDDLRKNIVQIKF